MSRLLRLLQLSDTLGIRRVCSNHTAACVLRASALGCGDAEDHCAARLGSILSASRRDD